MNQYTKELTKIKNMVKLGRIKGNSMKVLALHIKAFENWKITIDKLREVFYLAIKK